MVTISVSLPQEEYNKMVNGGHSQSKLLKLGLIIATKYGGVAAIEQTLKEQNQLKNNLNDMLEMVEEWKEKYKNCKESLDYAYQEIYKHAKKESKDKDEAKEKGKTNTVKEKLIEEVKALNDRTGPSGEDSL